MDDNEQTHENTEHRLQDLEVIYRKLICHGGSVDHESELKRIMAQQ